MIYLNLFLSFLKIGAFSIGGGYVVIPLIKSDIVDKHNWLSLSEFADLITIAEITPGPIAINSSTFVGLRVGGPFGAIIAVFGCILPSLFIVSILFFLYYKYKALKTAKNVLGVLRAVVVALIAGAAISIVSLSIFNGTSFNIANIDFISLFMLIIALLLLQKFKKPILIMFGCGFLRLIIEILIKNKLLIF